MMRSRRLQTIPLKIAEVMVLTAFWSIISFLLPLIWAECTPVPTDTADWTASEKELLDELVQFKCNENQYNQVASLLFTPADVAMQQLVRSLCRLLMCGE